jgi:hypothetical protein
MLLAIEQRCALGALNPQLASPHSKKTLERRRESD